MPRVTSDSLGTRTASLFRTAQCSGTMARIMGRSRERFVPVTVNCGYDCETDICKIYKVMRGRRGSLEIEKYMSIFEA